jgi:AcrR family transcriptional regulator
MAGKRQFDEEAVLERAVDVFWRRGFSATSVDDP